MIRYYIISRACTDFPKKQVHFEASSCQNSLSSKNWIQLKSLPRINEVVFKVSILIQKLFFLQATSCSKQHVVAKCNELLLNTRNFVARGIFITWYIYRSLSHKPSTARNNPRVKYWISGRYLLRRWISSFFDLLVSRKGPMAYVIH